MQKINSTEIKYAIMDRVTNNLIGYSVETNAYCYACVPESYILNDYQHLPIWYVDELETAKYVLENSTPWYNASYDSPRHSIDISPESHCVVEVEMIRNMRIVE